MTVKLTPEARALFVKRWNDGAPAQAIADELGVSFGWVGSLRQKLGLKPRRLSGVKPRPARVAVPVALFPDEIELLCEIVGNKLDDMAQLDRQDRKVAILLGRVKEKLAPLYVPGEAGSAFGVRDA